MNFKDLDKIGILGVFLTALVSPCCFPLLGFGLTALGFGTFELFGERTMWVIQGLVLISIIGIYFSYRKHKNIWPIIIALGSALLIILVANFYYNDIAMYAGMFGLLLSSGMNYYINKKYKSCEMGSCEKEKKIEMESLLTCPVCQNRKKEIMPDNSCQWFYECENCKTLLKPKPGDCCVFCSYGTVKCPPIQIGNSCC